jgi:signal transduction histidine kinase
MTHEEAVAALKSPNMHERLRASRFFVHTAKEYDYNILAEALAHETVVWIKTALHNAIRRASGKSAQRSVSTRHWADIQPEDEAYAKAVEDTTRRLVHELEPILGIVGLHASLEVPNFDQSRTARGLTRLLDTLSAISTLGKAAAVPKLEEFDLAELIRTVAESESESSNYLVKVEFAGIAPLIVIGDRKIVGIVVANAIRNGLEATSVSGRMRQPVIVNWGSTTKEYWITVLDHGVGLPLRASRVYDIGSTTKADHLGMGLAICFRAARTLNGHIELSRRDEKGASFQFRWPRPFTESLQ